MWEGGGNELFQYKSTITVDSKGRILIPLMVRDRLELKQGDVFILEYQDGIITLTFLGEEEK